MIKIIHIITAALFILILFGFNDDSSLYKESVRRIQKELREKMSDVKYDGSKATYFMTKNNTQFKEVEVVLFLRDRNYIYINGELVAGKVGLKIYDGPSQDQNRLTLYESKNIANKLVVVEEEELNNRLRFYDPNPKKLRSVYIDYEIAKSKKEERGAVVMAIGYKNKEN